MGPDVYQRVSNYSFEFDLLLVAAALVFLAVVIIAVPLPYRLFRLAWHNRIRLDGSASQRRARRELHHLTDFLGNLLLIPLLFAGAFIGVLTVVHAYVIPIPLAADVLSMFDPDPAVWEERTETGRLGDVGVLYGEWSGNRGFSADRAYMWRTFLKQHWLELLLGAGVFGAFFCWFMTRYYTAAVDEYQAGVFRRRKHYRERDLEQVVGASRPSL